MLSGKNIIITGANRGIGAETVRECARQHANVLACSRTRTDEFEQELNTLAAECGIDCISINFDMRNHDEMKRALKEIRSVGLPIHGLVNNAGILHPPTPFLMTSMDQMRAMMEVNFFATALFTQYVLRLMLKCSANEGCSIVNLASIAALDGAPGEFAYSSSKGAIIGMTKELAVEYGGQNIRVNAIAPGIIKTDMLNHLEDEFTESATSRNALHRLGLAHEVASVSAFLLSDAASYITGQVLRVDAGGSLNV